MKVWLVLIGIQVMILALGFAFLGEQFLAVAIFGAPVVNLLLWTGLICLAGCAASATPRSGFHRRMMQVLLIAAVIWFPVSLGIFGNAHFSGTTPFLWQAWLAGTASIILLSLGSILSSMLRRLLAGTSKPT